MSFWQTFLLLGTIYLAPNLPERARRIAAAFCFGVCSVSYWMAR